MSLSPAISFEVSITITLFSLSSAKTRAISRIIVVLPIPGFPKTKIELSDSSKSRIIEIIPSISRPIRQVRPLIKNCLFLIQLIL